MDRHCVECDYSLLGHEPGAVCPECGTTDDPSIFVLHGYFGEASDSATPLAAVIRGFVLVLAVLLILQFVHRVTILFLLIGIVIALMLLESWMRTALMGLPEPTQKLLLSPLGFRQQPLHSSGKTKSKSRQAIEMVLLFSLLAGVFFIIPQFSSNWSALSGGIAALFAIGFRATRRSHLLEDVGGTQALVPWARVNLAKVTAGGFRARSSQVRIRILVKTAVSKREPAADMRWTPTRAQVDYVADFLQKHAGWKKTEIELGRFVPKMTAS